MQPVPHQDGRVCRSTPPWSLPDISPRFYYPAHMAPQMTLNEDFFRRFKKVELWIELPMSTLMLLDNKYVLKLIPPHWDVDTIVDHMRQARRILPVPYVYEFGRLGNCCFIVMEYVRGTTFSAVTREHGHYAAVRLKPQIAEIVTRLNSVGLAHNDLHPRNIIVDRYYNVVALLDWDYAAPAEHSQDEYLRRLHPRFDFERDRNPDPEFDLPVYTEHDECWDFLFLRNTLDRADAAASSIREFDNSRRGVAKLPPASKTWCFRTHSSVVPPHTQRERLSSYSPAKHVALLASGCNSDWDTVMAALSGHAKVCLLVTDDSEQADRMRSHGNGTPVRLLDPCALGHLPGLEPEPSSALDSDLAHAVAEARTHAVVLCDWQHELGDAFWSMVQVPPILSKPAKPLTVASLRSLNDTRTHAFSVHFSSLTRTRSHTELPIRNFLAAEVQSSCWYEATRRDFFDKVARRLVHMMAD